MGRGPRNIEAEGPLSARSLLYGPRRSLHTDESGQDKPLYLYPSKTSGADLDENPFVARQKIETDKGTFFFSTANDPQAEEDDSLWETYAAREIGQDHIAEAEVLVDRATEIMGPGYEAVFARRQKGEVAGKEGIVTDYVAGETYQETATILGQYEARKRLDGLGRPGIGSPDVHVLSGEERDTLHKAKESFFYNHDSLATRAEWLDKARRILFADNVLLNDRGADGIVLSEAGPVSVFDGLALSQDQYARPVAGVPPAALDRDKKRRQRVAEPDGERYDPVYYKEIVEQTGGRALLEEERAALNNLLASDFLTDVDDKLGSETATAVRERIKGMLKDGLAFPA